MKERKPMRYNSRHLVYKSSETIFSCKMKQFILSICIVFLVTSVTHAQNVKGKLVDNDNNPLVGANVLLLSKMDSTFITGTVTDKEGNFVLASEKDGGTLMFSYIGYQSIYHTLTGENVGTIIMQENAQLLDAVSVTANRVVNSAQGYSIRPAGSGLENCNTPQEMFSFLPGISVLENKIMLLDKLPVVYVNGLRITSQDELAALLPKRIESIEVDYLAVGEGATEKGGVIRITTVKEKDGGFSGYLSAKVGALSAYGYNHSAPTFVFDASIGKWTFNYYVINTHKQLLEDATNSYLYDSAQCKNTYSKVRSWMNNFGSRLNISYELNDRTTFAVSEYIGNITIKNRQRNRVDILGEDDEKMQQSNVLLHGPEYQFEQQTVAKYNLHTDSKGSNLEITADYLLQDHHFKQFEDENGTRIFADSTMERTNMFRFNSRYAHKFAGGKELKVGADYQFIRYYDKSNNLTSRADARIPSAYVNFSGMAKTLMYSAGVTLQSNRMKVHTAGDITLFDDLHFCPQASLMWMINPKRGTMFGVMYQSTVSDMPYSVINGYQKYSTPFQYTTGNPSLLTPKENEVMVRFALNRHVSAMFLYHREANPIYYKHGIDEQNDNITWSRPENGKYRRMLGARIELSYTPFNWWNTKIQTAAMQDKFVSDNETLKGQWGGKFWWNNNFNFAPSFGASLNGYWETKTSLENYYWQPVGNVNASMWKSFYNDKLRLSVQSTICAKGRKRRTEGDGYTSYYHNRTRPTSFILSITWSFSGGKKVKKRSEAKNIQQYNKIEEKK